MSLVVLCATLLPPSLRKKPISPNSLSITTTTTTTTRFYDDQQTAKIPSSSDHLLPCFFSLDFQQRILCIPGRCTCCNSCSDSVAEFPQKISWHRSGLLPACTLAHSSVPEVGTYQTRGRYLPNQW